MNILENIFYDYTNEFVYIYCIKFNKKGYIGSTCNPRQRMLQHFNSLRKNSHFNSCLQRAWNKYGEEKFQFEILTKDKFNCRNILEEEYIKNNPLLSSYNLSLTFNIQNLVLKNRKLTKKDIVYIFNSVNKGEKHKDIAKKLNISRQVINKIILKHIYKDYSVDLNIDINLYKKNKNENKSKTFSDLYGYKIFMYDLKGNLIKTFNNVKEACIYTNFSKTNISNSIFRNHQHKGFLFKKQKEDFCFYDNTVNKNNYIYEYTFDFQFKQKYKNMAVCSNNNNINPNSLNSNCRRLQKNKITNSYFVREKDINKFKVKFNLNEL